MTITDKQYAAFGKRVAAQMGANLEWDSAADYLDDFATAARNLLGVRVGGQGNADLTFWRDIADEIGVYYEERPCSCSQWNSEEPGHEHRGDTDGCTVESCYCDHFDRTPYRPGGELYKED